MQLQFGVQTREAAGEHAMSNKYIDIVEEHYHNIVMDDEVSANRELMFVQD